MPLWWVDPRRELKWRSAPLFHGDAHRFRRAAPVLIIFSLNTMRVPQEETSEIGFSNEKRGSFLCDARPGSKKGHARLFKRRDQKEIINFPSRLMNNNSSICVALRGRLQSNTATALLYISYNTAWCGAARMPNHPARSVCWNSIRARSNNFLKAC